MNIAYKEFKTKLKEAFEKGQAVQRSTDHSVYSKREAELDTHHIKEKNLIRQNHAKEMKRLHNEYKQMLMDENNKRLDKYKRIIKAKNDEINNLKASLRDLHTINRQYKQAVDLTFDIRHQLVNTMERMTHLHDSVLITSTDLYQIFNKISDELAAKNATFSKSEDKIREILLLEEPSSVATLMIIGDSE